MNQVLLSIIKKEFWHILRDRQTLVIILLMPLMMMILYGYAINLEMRQIETVVNDASHTPDSREFIQRMEAVSFFDIVGRDMQMPADDIFKQRLAQVVINIPVDFSDQLNNQLTTPVQLLVDASDPNAANFINNYLNLISFNFSRSRNQQIFVPFSIEPRLLYNPDLKSSYFFVPGLVAVILLLISALLTSITIVREKETGTMEQILVSPVHPFQIIIGKVIPFVALGYAIGLFILLFAHFWFHVPVYGSGLLLNAMLLLYIFTGLSIGLFISTIANTQQIAMMAALVATILPTVMMSGFIFPISSMPQVLQYVAQIIPATHFLQIIRGIMLKGNGLLELYRHVAILCVESVFLIVISVKKFKSGLE